MSDPTVYRTVRSDRPQTVNLRSGRRVHFTAEALEMELPERDAIDLASFGRGFTVAARKAKKTLTSNTKTSQKEN